MPWMPVHNCKKPVLVCRVLCSITTWSMYCWCYACFSNLHVLFYLVSPSLLVVIFFIAQCNPIICMMIKEDNKVSVFCILFCKHYRKCDVIYRYLHIELIWCLLMVQYLQNNVIMKLTTRFIRFTGWIPLKYGSTITPPIIAHCQKTPMSSVVFHIAIPKTSNIRRTPSFDLLTDEFSKRVSIIRRALY